MSTEDCSGLTTDAVPNPKKSTVPESTNRTQDEDIEDETKDFDDEIRTSDIKRNPFRGFTKPKKNRVPVAQATVINITNSNGIHVGDQFVYNANERSDSRAKKIKETDAIRTLKKSQTLLNKDDFMFVAKHMNESWKDAIRKLKYSDGQIEQYVIDHHHLGIKEVIFQLLLSWSQNEPEEATVGNLATILWSNNQQDVVKRLSEKDN